MPAVTVDGVTVGHDGARRLDDVHLAIEDGELLVVIGPSGSGKTTLLRVLAGLEPVDAGRVLIDDHDVTEVPAAQRDVAMVFQEGSLQRQLTARDNIAFPLRLLRSPGPEVTERVEASARVMGLSHLLDRLPRQLSAGSRQAVETTRELGRAVGLFLLDEPLANVDSHERQRLRRELAMVQRAAGVTMVYATNDQTEAMALGDRVAVLVAGQVVQVGPPLELYERPATIEVATLLGSPPTNLLSAADVTVSGRVPDGRVLVGVRPADLDPEPRRQGLHVRVSVMQVTSTGPELHVRGRVAGTTVTAVLRTPLAVPEPTVGEELDLYADPDRLRFFDYRTGVAVG
ncbi:MAG: ABC transporter ATP-binding protein [Actinobacteria bacterium]|nr:ABC transporter ATP-binding protein [Actinomycetota bacterium]